MEKGADALGNDRDWVVPLMGCHSDPEEGYLHTVLATGEVLPFSLALAVAYEYPAPWGNNSQTSTSGSSIVASMEYH